MSPDASPANEARAPDVIDPVAKPSRLRRFLRPDWKRRKSLLRAEVWLVILASYVLLGFAYLWPQDWRNESTLYVIASWIAVTVRMLQVHLGIVLLVIAVAAGLLRGRRMF